VRRTFETATVPLLVAAALLVAACSGGDDEAEDTTTSTRRRASTTTSTEPVHTGAPLTGLPGDPAALARPALVVKYDNAPKGRPQEGINQADVVVEEEVEGGVTRLAAIFHATPPAQVGPVRSARSSDIVLAAPLRRPLFAYSGTNAAFQAQIDQAALVALPPGAVGGAYFRVGGRPAPYNLWARTDALFGAAPEGSQPPPPLFRYRGDGDPVTGDAGTRIIVEFRDRVETIAVWEWDARAGAYARTQNGTPHVDAAGDRVATRNVIVQFTEYVNTPFVDQSGAPVPEAELVGEGDAVILTGGRVVHARWRRTTPEEPTTYVDREGRPVLLTRGQTWLELPRPGMASLG